jgi:hypothetical protein
MSLAALSCPARGRSRSCASPPTPPHPAEPRPGRGVASTPTTCSRAAPQISSLTSMPRYAARPRQESALTAFHPTLGASLSGAGWSVRAQASSRLDRVTWASGAVRTDERAALDQPGRCRNQRAKLTANLASWQRFRLADGRSTRRLHRRRQCRLGLGPGRVARRLPGRGRHQGLPGTESVVPSPWPPEQSWRTSAISLVALVRPAGTDVAGMLVEDDPPATDRSRSRANDEGRPPCRRSPIFKPISSGYGAATF